LPDKSLVLNIFLGGFWCK